ncbi:DUF2958 domain-containing protein [Methylobacterium radiotolerans]|uniref:DUF2958 domain-containing protein n=1 Tax=Methylobacterium radiotolerans TaxID=31998 RepID=UPI001F289A91|nr:DUF2958 domain-containing protein [Methylobacterium radiotolerans]UIY45842.1 DUF2958 domain-containing protein [Methylobacterium radiotolerans]
MRGTLIYPHERKALEANGLTAVRRRQTDFAPVVRLWFQTSPLSWLLTHTLPENGDMAYGLAVQGGSEPSYELGYWSLAAFESFNQGDPRTGIISSSVFQVHAPLSSYIRALVRRRVWGY